MLLDNIIDIAIIGGVGFIGYEYLKCARKVGSLAPLDVLGCSVEELGKDVLKGVEGVANTVGDAGCRAAGIKVGSAECEGGKEGFLCGLTGLCPPPKNSSHRKPTIDCSKLNSDGCSVCAGTDAPPSSFSKKQKDQFYLSRLENSIERGPVKGVNGFRNSCKCVGTLGLDNKGRFTCTSGPAVCRLNANGTIQCYMEPTVPNLP